MDALGHYLVELHQPPGGWKALQELAARARASADGLTAEGTQVRFLRSIFVPQENSCFFLYEGASAAAVSEAGRRAALGFGDVAPTLHLQTQRPEQELK